MDLDLKGLARLGAQIRLTEIDRERALIEKAFPDLQQPVSSLARATRNTRMHATTPAIHWTQQPKNRARMLRLIRKASKARHQSSTVTK